MLRILDIVLSHSKMTQRDLMIGTFMIQKTANTNIIKDFKVQCPKITYLTAKSIINNKVSVLPNERELGLNYHHFIKSELKITK